MMKKILALLCGYDQNYATFPPADDIENQYMNGYNIGQQHALTQYGILHRAATEGDWETAKPIFMHNLDYARHRITKAGGTLLHVAVAAETSKRSTFVRELVNILHPYDLELRNDSQRTAFVYAVEIGDVELVEIMAQRNPSLLTIYAYDEVIPLQVAILTKDEAMIEYLYGVTPFENLHNLDRIHLLEATIQNDMYDMALKILENDRSLATSKLPLNHSFLNVLIRKRDVKEGGLWRKLIGGLGRKLIRAPTSSMNESYLSYRSKEMCNVGQVFEKICNLWLSLPEGELTDLMKSTEILHYAAKEGNAEFLAMVLRKKPALSLVLNKKGQTIFHVAVSHRQEKVFNLMYNIGPFKELIRQVADEEGNNILHFAALLGHPVRDKCAEGQETEKILPRQLVMVSGAALQLQREILWFEEVKKVMPPTYCKMINGNGRTPEELFLVEHKGLIREGEKWMRDTANSCMIVATLIATVVFAAAFTVPGGYDQVSGIPILVKQRTFTVFAISDAVAMVCSIMSIIMFLSILTSRYRKTDFRWSLPVKLLVGLTTLFVSIVGMLLAFTIAFFLVYRKEWEPKLIAALAGVQFILFLYLNWQLGFEMVRSIIGSASLFKPSKLMIYSGLELENRRISSILHSTSSNF